MINGPVPVVGTGLVTCTYVVVLSDLYLNVARIPAEQIDVMEAPESSRYVASPGPRRTRVTADLRAEVMAQYQRGRTSRQVADGLAIAKSTVLQILRSEGVEVRPWGVRDLRAR